MQPGDKAQEFIVDGPEDGWELIKRTAKALMSKPDIAMILVSAYDRVNRTYTVTVYCRVGCVRQFMGYLRDEVLVPWDVEHRPSQLGDDQGGGRVRGMCCQRRQKTDLPLAAVATNFS